MNPSLMPMLSVRRGASAIDFYRAAFGATVPAVIIWPVPERHEWRVGRLVDPFGYHWKIGKPL